MQEKFFAIYLVVTMAPSVLGNKASTFCGDATGYNCLYKTNTEELADVRIQFDSPLPLYLTGTLIRNGLGQFERGEQSVTHVFDGFAKLSKWNIFSNGTAFFSTRFIRSGFYKKTMKTDHLAPYLPFSPPKPPFNKRDKIKCFMNGIDNMNVNIIDFPGKSNRKSFAAYSDSWISYQVSAKDLSTIKKIKPKLPTDTIWKKLTHLDILSSAHPLPEPGTKNRLTFLIRQKTMSFIKNRLVLVRMSSVSKRSKIAEWKLKDVVPYMHSFSVTQTKAVMLAAPYLSNLKCLIKTAAPLPCMEWFENKSSTLYIVIIKTKKKITLKMPALFVLHHINAYDLNDNEIIMDVSSYDSPEIVTTMLQMDVITNEIKRNRTMTPPRNKRIHINLARKSAKILDYSTNDRDGLDMPVINEKYRSKKYCYVYGLNLKANSVVKKDMCNGGVVAGSIYMYHHYPLEPAFVPKPGSNIEDDGVLLVPYLHGPDVMTYLAVLDARSMNMISKADLPTFLPFSLHGRFYSEHF